jgi:hypothetical protein
MTVNELHGVISQKTVLFITTNVRTSNPTLNSFSWSNAMILKIHWHARTHTYAHIWASSTWNRYLLEYIIFSLLGPSGTPSWYYSYFDLEFSIRNTK